jgi:hypothetical protein
MALLSTSDYTPINYGIGLAGGIDADSGSALFNNNVPRGAASRNVNRIVNSPQSPIEQVIQQAPTKADGDPAVVSGGVPVDPMAGLSNFQVGSSVAANDINTVNALRAGGFGAEADVYTSAMNPSTTGLAGAWDTIGGAKGFADIGGGLASLYGIYQGMQQNKRADEAFRMQKAEYNRGVKKDKDFGDAVNRSGLGSYSAGA